MKTLLCLFLSIVTTFAADAEALTKLGAKFTETGGFVTQVKVKLAPINI